MEKDKKRLSYVRLASSDGVGDIGGTEWAQSHRSVAAVAESVAEAIQHTQNLVIPGDDI